MRVRRKHRARLGNLGLALVSVLLTLVLCEMGLRAYCVFRTSRELDRMRAAAPERIDTPYGVLGPGVRLSDKPNVVYELRPNLRGSYDGRRYASNRYGFRQDQEFPVEKPKGVLRVVGIGDSWMWGSGVDNGSTYLDQLAQILASGPPKVEVINTGVWGYNAQQEMATLRWKGRIFAPDVVVIGLCGNDREYPSFLSSETYVRLSRSFLWNEISGRLRKLEGKPGPVPSAGEQMPYSEFLAAYAELAELSKSDGFDVVVFSECLGTSDPHDAENVCPLGSRTEWVDFLDHLDAWHFRRCPWDIAKIPQNHPNWGHATEEGNRMLAETLAACLRPLLEQKPK